MDNRGMSMSPTYQRGIVAIAVGMAIIFLGDVVTGANLETFQGISTFTFGWMVDVFFVPFVAGLIVAKIFRERGGKYLACLPPLFVRFLTYVYLFFFVYHDGKDFFFHMNLYYWGPCLILVVEAANFGAIIGEVLAGAYRSKNEQVAESGASGE